MSTQLDQHSDKKSLLKSPRVRVTIALVIILMLVVLSFFAPHEGDSNNVTGDTVPAPLVVTNAIGTLAVNRGMDFEHVHITVTRVDEAGAFSDDHKRAGKYTVRVYLQARNEEQAPVGIDYPTLTSLLLPNGQAIAPKFVAIAPAVLPNSEQAGFIDFPVNAPVSLSSLILRLGSPAGRPQEASLQL